MEIKPRQVPYVDIARQHRRLKAEILEAVGAVIDSGSFILGEQLADFEARFAKLCGCRFAVGVNSGTDALGLSLRAVGVGPGDEVITPTNSFIASASCVVALGARPVLVDVREDYNVDPEKVEHAITPRTKAILPVHLTGRIAEMDTILAIANRRGIPVIEDAAQAVCAEQRGRRAGSLGLLGCFSLHPLKTLNACGDGGVVTTNDEKLYERLKLLRNFGLPTRDDCVEWGINSRLDTLQAAILLVKLRYLEAWVEKRRANAAFYLDALKGIAGVSCPAPGSDEKPAYHTFMISAERRDELKAFLAGKGIGSAIHYPVPIHLMTVGRQMNHKPGDFPVAERLAGRILSLPVYPELEHDDLACVAATIRTFYEAV